MTIAPAAPAPRPRYELLDIARAIGIILVIYGHFLQSLFHADAPLIFRQYQVIYAFHMPLFFILSGMVGQIAPTTFRKNLRSGLELVVLAYLVNLIGLGLSLFARGPEVAADVPNLLTRAFTENYMTVGVMWFLMALGLVRLTLGSALLVASRPLRLAAVAVVMAALAAWFHSRTVAHPVWQDTTLFFGALFFLVGRWVPLAWVMAAATRAWGLLLTIPATIALATLNTGCAFSMTFGPACGGPMYDGMHPVLMVMGEYNNYPMYVAGAVVGTLMCLQLASLVGRTLVMGPTLTSIGRQTLGIILLNGLYCNFLGPVVEVRLPHEGIGNLALIVCCIGLTLLQLLAYQFMKPATDSLIAMAGWAARRLTGTPAA